MDRNFSRPSGVIFILALVALGGCTTFQGKPTSGIGAGAGVLAGAAAGALVCRGKAAIPCAVGGAIIGGLAGNELEGALSKQPDTTNEYYDEQSQTAWVPANMAQGRCRTVEDKFGRKWAMIEAQVCMRANGGNGFNAPVAGSRLGAFPPAPAGRPGTGTGLQDRIADRDRDRVHSAVSSPTPQGLGNPGAQATPSPQGNPPSAGQGNPSPQGQGQGKGGKN
ncbi:MAG: hypothetical protein COY40_01110 [Alphaproteobacteria bacterium CG_4_10_14_0_8_um_filter_53_9]|nr:MAG: hypothetical protein COY40_01110 [Alphaproteobacteria bacterium CG_4_10_14_0_8_um_filter_53_9]